MHLPILNDPTASLPGQLRLLVPRQHLYRIKPDFACILSFIRGTTCRHATPPRPCVFIVSHPSVDSTSQSSKPRRTGAAALVRFEKALLMSRNVSDLVLQRRAMRGMAASSRMQGNNQSAIKHLKGVLELSKSLNEYTGDADAYGSIADIYADMGDFDSAASFYDQYIQRMQEDGQAV